MRRSTLPAGDAVTIIPRCRLAWARILAHMTQADLAGRLGLSRTWVSGVEHGNIIPTRQQQIRIAQILNLDVDAIFGDEEEGD